MLECLGCQRGSIGEGEAAGLHRGQHVVVVTGVDDHGHRRVVLGRRAHHGRAADVDLLDAFVGGGATGHGLGERVEVHHHQFERLDPEFGQLVGVLLLAQVGQDLKRAPADAAS